MYVGLYLKVYSSTNNLYYLCNQCAKLVKGFAPNTTLICSRIAIGYSNWCLLVIFCLQYCSMYKNIERCTKLCTSTFPPDYIEFLIHMVNIYCTRAYIYSAKKVRSMIIGSNHTCTCTYSIDLLDNKYVIQRERKLHSWPSGEL